MDVAMLNLACYSLPHTNAINFQVLVPVATLGAMTSWIVDNWLNDFDFVCSKPVKQAKEEIGAASRDMYGLGVMFGVFSKHFRFLFA